MRIAQWNYLGPRSTPQEVRSLRKHSFESHRTHGMPVIHKHKWTPQDVRDGKARWCPFHDIAYDGSSVECEYCFGTGILGGWSDAAITFITLADAPEDELQILPSGVIMSQRHPTFTGPWVPAMGDGDLIITADFEYDTWEIIEEQERYVLREVEQRTMRGFQKKVQTREYRVHQEGQIDELPHGDYRYDVPLVFDYGAVEDPVIPPGGDPDDYPVPGQGHLSHAVWGIQVRGGEFGQTIATERIVQLDTLGSNSVRTTGVRVEGESGGVIIVFEEENY